MAARHLTRRYPNIGAFLDDIDGSMKADTLLVPADQVTGELDNQLRLDIEVPGLARMGPITAQVVHRAPDGSVALRLPAMEGELGPSIRRVQALVVSLEQWLVQRGDLISVVQHEAALAARPEPSDQGQWVESGGTRPDLEGSEQPPVAASHRGLSVPDMREIPATIEGSMADRSLRDAMVQLAIERVTGLLTIRAQGIVRYGFWDKGGPVGWTADPMQESEVLGMLLFKAGQIDKAQLQRSLELMQENGQRQGEALIEMNVMTYPQLVMVLGKQVEFVLQRAMASREGRWSFHLLERLPERFLPAPLRVPGLLYRALVKHTAELRTEDLAEALRPRLDRYVFVQDEALEVLSEIRFVPAEKKLLEVLQSTSWRLREFYAVSPLSRMRTSAVILALDELGFLRFDEHEDLHRTLERLGHQVLRKFTQVSRSSLFDVLEVHWICLPREVEDAYNRLKAEYGHEQFHILPPAQQTQLKVIQEQIEAAWNRLRTDAGRREYRKEVIEAGTIVQSAELLGRKGDMAIMRQDRRDACACFGKALELTPGNAEYREGLKRATLMGA